MKVKQCHEFFHPFGNRLFIPHNGDDRGMVYGIVFFLKPTLRTQVDVELMHLTNLALI